MSPVGFEATVSAGKRSQSYALDSARPLGPAYYSFRHNNLLFNIVFGYIISTRVGTLIVATIYLQLIQNRYMYRSFTNLQCSHQHCVQPVGSDVEVVGYL